MGEMRSSVLNPSDSLPTVNKNRLTRHQNMRRHGMRSAWGSPPQIQSTCPVQRFSWLLRSVKHVQFMARNVYHSVSEGNYIHHTK